MLEKRISDSLSLPTAWYFIDGAGSFRGIGLDLISHWVRPNARKIFFFSLTLLSGSAKKSESHQMRAPSKLSKCPKVG